jgi:hypothetical protein
MFRSLKRRRERKEQAAADAAALIAQFGERAYAEARHRAREARQGSVFDGNRPDGHWDRVRALIGGKTRREHVDTATRYLGGT